MKKNKLILSVAALALMTAASFNAITAETTPADTDSNPNHSMKRWVYPEPAKKELNNKAEQTVAWYVANTKEAQEQNQECHDNPSIQSTPNCVNSLHALQIIFAGR
ncbi:MAG: EexN family lipoprotein [Methylococcaceae bacterium]|nr:EexN family lipoprotein [Methylococcaceae bacterium]